VKTWVSDVDDDVGKVSCELGPKFRVDRQVLTPNVLPLRQWCPTLASAFPGASSVRGGSEDDERGDEGRLARAVERDRTARRGRHFPAPRRRG